jgi:alpha-beta hydrolase superfamily lysophospholipase
MLAHSMGSLAARAYIQTHGKLLSGLILSGNPGYNALSPLGAVASRWMQRWFGDHAMCSPLTLGVFTPFRLRSHVFYSRNGWVCSDRAVVRAYDADPLCGFEFSANGYEALMNLMMRAYDPKAKAPSPELPIAFFSGEKDPCMAGEKNLRRAAQLLKDAGYRSVSIRLYPRMMHEILNEPGKDSVRMDMVETIEKWLPEI